MFAASKTASVSGGYQISRSLRFNSADSTNLTRTPASASNRKTWTWSGWVKRTALGLRQGFFSCQNGAGNASLQFGFLDTDVFQMGNGSVYVLQSSSVYRDPSAWYHVVVSVNTTLASNRCIVYINGSQITAWGTNTFDSTFAQNSDTAINNNLVHYLGQIGSNLSYLDGYMTEVNFIDGQQLTPSSFGETNAQTGVWQPKAYSGSYGTNGFYLNFSDNSNTTAATLGKDYSGNGNNWTPNNFSVTAGAGNDSLVDSPTSYGTDTGVGGTVRGNYCTLNPLSPPSSGSPAYSNGNLDGAVAGYSSLVSTLSMTSGQWYWEVTPTGNSGSAGYFAGGVSDANFPMSTRTWTGANFWGYFQNGSKYTNSGSAAYGASYTTNDVIGVALDMDAGTVTFYKNGTSQGVAYSGLTGKSMQATVADGTTTSLQYYSCNFGQRPFAYTAPSGYKALCTQNLPTPTIGATTATQAGKYFNPVLYTGTGATLAVTGAGFQPDLVWIKQRNASRNHNLYDAVRGALKVLQANVTDAEVNYAGSLTSFDSDGFSLGTASDVNVSSATYVAWNWKANGSGSTNTNGSVTSTVSANTTSGFSVVTWTGSSAGQTVGHGLGVAPSLIITKTRSATGENWPVYHKDLGIGSILFLNTTGSVNTTYPTYWGSSAPTSTVFGTFTGGYPAGNNNGNMVAYCFAEVAGYSKFGSYTGNGSADGPFCYTGFRPAYVMIRVSSAASQWLVFDAARNTANAEDNILYPNTSVAEDKGVGTSPLGVDFLSNGFKIRTTDAWANPTGGTVIFAAFASAPQKFSLAR